MPKNAAEPAGSPDPTPAPPAEEETAAAESPPPDRAELERLRQRLLSQHRGRR